LKLLKSSAAGLAIISLGSALAPVLAQNAGIIDPTQTLDWAPGAIAHAQKMRQFKDAARGSQSSPADIPQFSVDPDPSGQIATFQPNGGTAEATNAFFQDFGTNGRTCFTCHQPQTGWTISAASAQARFKASGIADPL